MQAKNASLYRISRFFFFEAKFLVKLIPKLLKWWLDNVDVPEDHMMEDILSSSISAM